METIPNPDDMTIAQIEQLAEIARQGGVFGVAMVILVLCAIVLHKYIMSPLLTHTKAIAEAQRDTSANCLAASREARETTQMLLLFMERNGVEIKPEKRKVET